MKRSIAVLLLLTLMLSFAACDSEPVGYNDHFNYEVPEDKVDHTKTILERADFDKYVESILNVQAHPDILMYDETGSQVIGMYIYDPETGLATGWTDLTTGEQHIYEKGQEVNLGKPDPEKTVDLDAIKLGAVVYEKDGKVTGAELLFFLANAQDAETLQRFMVDYYGEALTKESDTQYKIVKDEEAVMRDFLQEEKAGNAFFSKNAAEYVSVLKINYGVVLVQE